MKKKYWIFVVLCLVTLFYGANHIYWRNIPIFPIDEHDLCGIMVYKDEIVSGHHYDISGENVTRLVDALNQLELHEEEELSGYSYKVHEKVFEQRKAFMKRRHYEIWIRQTAGFLSQDVITRIVYISKDGKMRVECLEDPGKVKYYTVLNDDCEDFIELLDEIANECFT